MPWKPLRPCNHPGCPSLSDQAYCEQHRKEVKGENNRRYDTDRRDKGMRAFYTSTAWRHLRELKLKQMPMCEECYRQGRISKAVIVDHIKPARESLSDRLNIDNLQSLCRSCHNKKTATDRTQGDDDIYKF